MPDIDYYEATSGTENPPSQRAWLRQYRRDLCSCGVSRDRYCPLHGDPPELIARIEESKRRQRRSLAR